MLSPLAVPKIVCSLFTSHNFDRYANSHSLHRPQDAVVFLAPSLFATQSWMIRTSHHRERWPPLLLKQEGEAIASIELKKNRKRTTLYTLRVRYILRTRYVSLCETRI